MSPVSVEEYVAVAGRTTANMTKPTVAELRKAYRAWQAGAITTDGLVRVIADVLMIANAHARGVGDVLAAVGMGQLAGTTNPAPLGTSPHIDVADELARLTAAAGTIVATIDQPDADLAMQLDRIATAEPTQAIRDQMRVTYEGRGVDRWTRGLNGGACELCQSWATLGSLPTSVEMLHHPGCGCVPIPVTERNPS